MRPPTASFNGIFKTLSGLLSHHSHRIVALPAAAIFKFSDNRDHGSHT